MYLAGVGDHFQVLKVSVGSETFFRCKLQSKQIVFLLDQPGQSMMPGISHIREHKLPFISVILSSSVRVRAAQTTRFDEWKAPDWEAQSSRPHRAKGVSHVLG